MSETDELSMPNETASKSTKEIMQEDYESRLGSGGDYLNDTLRKALMPSKPQKDVNINDLREVVQEEFPDTWFGVEAALSTIAELMLVDIQGCPSMIFEGPPASEKTTILGYFYGIENIIYKSDDFTPASFVTHSASVKRKDLDKIDMLPRIRFKTLLTAEMAPIFEGRPEDLKRKMAIITRVMDGEGYQSDSGVQGHRGYQGDYLFGWLGATTPLRRSHWDITGKMGSRWLFFDMNTELDDCSEGGTERLIGTPYKEKGKRVRLVMADFVRGLWHKYGGVRTMSWDGRKDPPNVIETILKLASLLATLRSPVLLNVVKVEKIEDEDGKTVDGQTVYDWRIPIIERPLRAEQLLYNLAKGHALVHGRMKLEEHDIPLLVKVVMSTMPIERRRIFAFLLESNGAMDIHQVQDAVHVSDKTAKKLMKELEVLEIVESEMGGESGRRRQSWEIHPKWDWLFGRDFQKYTKGGGATLE